jgi:hypothetical protein
MVVRLIQRLGCAVAVLTLYAIAWSVQAADDSLPS